MHYQPQGSHGIDQAFNDVRKMHLASGHPAPLTPTMQPRDAVQARANWVLEEVGELMNAKTLFDQADAYLDIIYFGLGGLVELGVIPGNLWQIVSQSNEAKIQPDGTVHKRPEDGKWIKPEGWVRPEADLYDEIERQCSERSTCEGLEDDRTLSERHVITELPEEFR